MYNNRPPFNTTVIPGFPPKTPYSEVRPANRISVSQAFINSKIANESYTRLGKKTMIGFFTLKNGHEVLTSYQYTDASAFDERVAMEQCKKQAFSDIWEFFSFYTQEARYHIDDVSVDTGDIPYIPLKPKEEIIDYKEAQDILKQNIKVAKRLNKEGYTSDSWLNLETILAEAETVVGLYSPTQEELEEANERLVTAMTMLKPRDEQEGQI